MAEYERCLIASYEDEIEESFGEQFSLKELTAQLCELEARLDIRLGDLPAAQIIRTACRRLELQRREIERLTSDRRAVTGDK